MERLEQLNFTTEKEKNAQSLRFHDCELTLFCIIESSLFHCSNREMKFRVSENTKYILITKYEVTNLYSICTNMYHILSIFF